ncbi:MAG: GIY-YIG nuclease family protein [Crocosphaera sp.]|nr:GIY-YIG nuclease family protein [Crocosphaera sp.]
MWLEYGLDPEQNLISISEVSRGKTTLKCPYCQGELIAKKGKVKAHHFAHAGETCNQVQGKEFDSVSLPFYDRFDLGLKPRYLKAMLENYEKGYRSIPNASYLSNYGITEYNEYAANGRGAWQYTKLGKMVLGDLSMMLFNQIQEPKIIAKLNSIEQSILEKKDFIATQSTNPLFKEAIPRVKQEIQDTIIDYQIYLLKYRYILSNSLYFLEIKADGEIYHKIGVTTRNLDQRIPEIKRDLAQHFSSVSIKGLGFWEHRGNVEYYFKYRYRKYNHRIGSLTEYFNFDDVKRVLRDLRRMKPKNLSKGEQEILDNKPLDKYLLSLYIRHGMEKTKSFGFHVGRPNITESTEQFLAKPKNQAIATVLKKGYSIRRTAKELGVAINTVRKVKASLEQ